MKRFDPRSGALAVSGLDYADLVPGDLVLLTTAAVGLGILGLGHRMENLKRGE